MATVKLFDLMDDVRTAYQNASNHVTWGNLALYGSILIISWIVYKAFIEPFLSPLRNMPGTSFNPFLGNMRSLLKGEAMEATIKIMKDHGALCRYYYMFGRERILVADPDVMKHILVTNSKNYVKPANRLSLMRMILGNGLVMSEGATHASHKRLLSPAFNNSSIKKMVSVFVKRSEMLRNFWTKKVNDGQEHEGTPAKPVEINVQNHFANTTLDIVGEIAFGYDFNCLETPEIEVNQAFQNILTGTGLTWKFALPYSHMMPFPEIKAFKHQIHVMNNTVQRIIDNKRTLLNQGADEESVTGDVLGQMLLARDEDGQGLNDTELRDEVMTLMLAGHETTAMCLSWCFLLMAQNPAVQAKAREEAERVLPKNPADITWDHIEQLDYCSCVIKETLRLCPPVPMTLRQSLDEDHLSTKGSPEYYIPARTISLLAVGPMMRREDLFENANKFLPERFLDSQVDSGFYGFLPFLIGPRMCLGYKFALIEMRLVLALVLRGLSFSPVPDVHFRRTSRITMRPNPSLRLLVNTV